jgi:hypothetical protein
MHPSLRVPTDVMMITGAIGIAMDAMTMVPLCGGDEIRGGSAMVTKGSKVLGVRISIPTYFHIVPM